MNDENNRESFNLAQISRATRFAIGCVVLCISYFSIRGSLSISNCERIFEDMFGKEESLPALTLFVLKARLFFVVISFSIPIVCIALLFTRNITRSLYGFGILVLVALAEAIVIFHALFELLGHIITKMSA